MKRNIPLDIGIHFEKMYGAETVVSSIWWDKMTDGPA